MSESPLPQPDLQRIGQLALPVADLDRSVAFYRDQLGLRFLFQAPRGLAFFDCAGLRLMLDAPAFERGNRFGSVLYFTVDDLPTTFAALGARGVRFESAPHLVARLPDREVWMAFFRDPDGSLLALMSEVSL
ncbi:MAG: VOC family protein [Thermoanaerobaculia bacterium]|nr:MAG: VOC family protein [Thermoanaerobaculia bacterium]MBZ0100887.1 VOC family protein [Thermoanaerobaculia bacterium]